MSPDLFVLGTAQLGGLYTAMDEGTARATLEAAWDAGVRSFDTAPHYGAGLAERRLGAFLRSVPREEFTVSTKVGRLLVDTDEDVEGVEGFYGGDRRRRVRNYSRDGVLRSLDDSLARLGLDHVDTLYLHDPDDHMDQAIGEGFPALAQLRDEGVIAHAGAGMNTVAPLIRLVHETDADQIMLAGRYTLIDRSAETELLPLCVQRSVAVVAAGVYNSGLLADPRPGAPFDYRPAPPEQLEIATRVGELCRQHQVPLRAAALQFPLTHPAVRAVAVGCRGPQQVGENLALLGTPLPADLKEALGYASTG
jgi:D-threo-aldose 1-dehydrogenase